MSTTATLAGLFFYPVKSARAIAAARVRVVATGFEWDRQWMIINERGTFLSQRTHPQLARLVPEIRAATLTIRAPGLPPLSLSLANDGAAATADAAALTRDRARLTARSAARVADGTSRTVRVHRDVCVGIDQGSAAAEWASRAVGETVRLVRVPADPARVANPAFTGTVPAPMGFADGYPILVTNENSLEDLNARLPASIPMERFRPNIVLRGLPAWAEDRIASLTVGELTLRLVKPCTRCTIPSIDQQSGLPSTDPAPVLRRFRFDRELLGVTFGENAVIAAGSGVEIECGARCRVSFEET